MCDAWCVIFRTWFFVRSWLYELRRNQKHPIWGNSDLINDIPKSIPCGSHMYTISCKASSLPVCKVRRHLRKTGPFKQENQKSWPEKFLRTLGDDTYTWTFFLNWEEQNHFCFFVILRFFWLFENFVIKFTHEKALNQNKTKNSQV